MSETSTTHLQDRLASMVHAFSDEDRRYAVRLLAADVGQLERELAAALERVKRLEEAGDAMASNEWTEDPLAVAWRKAKEAKP